MTNRSFGDQHDYERFCDERKYSSERESEREYSEYKQRENSDYYYEKEDRHQSRVIRYWED